MDSEARNPAVKTSNIKQCVICFCEFDNDNIPLSEFEKMYKLCRKHLHSDIMKETLAAKLDFSVNNSSLFCQNCFESAVELSEKTGQLEILQKSISELILMFSMGVLHRRSTAPKANQKSILDGDGKVKNNILEVECSGLTKCDSWAASTSRLHFPKKPYFEQATDDSNSSENDYPRFGIPGENDNNSVEIINVNDVDEDNDELGANSGRFPAYYPSAGYFTTLCDSTMPPVINTEDKRPPSPKRFILIPRSSSTAQPLALSKPPPAQPLKRQRKNKLVPLVELAEESSSSSSNTESPPKKKEKQPEERLYNLNPKDVPPGQDRRRVQRALNCYRYRLKKKQEVEETIESLNSQINKLKKQLITLKLRNKFPKKQRQ